MQSPRFHFNPFAADPVGEIVAQVRPLDEGLMLAEIVLDGRIHDRGFLQDRRPELFGGLVTPRPPEARTAGEKPRATP